MVGCNSHFSALVYLPGSMQVWVVSFWGHRQWSHHQWLSIIHVKHGTNHFGWSEFVEVWSFAKLKNEIFQNTHLEMVPGSSTQHWQQCWVFRQCFEAVAAGAVAESLFVHSWEKSSAIPGWQGRQYNHIEMSWNPGSASSTVHVESLPFVMTWSSQILIFIVAFSYVCQSQRQ